MGISVAFIDVVPPSTPEQSHVYMMFDSGIPGMDAAAISDNSKRYVIRKNTQGVETAWIPVETTDIRNGFEEAWNSGAAQYFQGAEVDLGIVHGWMKVVDLEPIY
jgi:folate-dependent phosphoribosylglycinamide formyltransferase PurN